MKKLTWLRLLVIMTAIALFLGACSAPSAPADTSGTKAPAAATAKPADDATEDGENPAEPEMDEPFEFSIAVRRGHIESGSVIQNYFEEKFNVRIEMIVIPDTSESQAKVNLLMADESQRPDVIWFQTAWTKEYTQWRDAGLLADVSDYYWTYPNIRDYYDKVSPDSLFFAVEPDGSLYAVPNDVGEPGHMTTLMRKDWLDFAGLDIPTTFDEYVNALRVMSKNNPNGGSGAYSFCGTMELRSLKPFWTYYDVIPDQFIYLADGSVGYGAVQPEMKEALSFIRDLYSEGIIDPNILVKDFNLTEALVAGSFGSTYRWIAWMNPEGSSMKSFLANNPDGEYISVEPFVNPKGSQSDNSASPQSWCAFAITNKASDPEKIYAFIDSLTAPENYLVRVYGFEGEHYTREDGVYKSLVTAEENAAQNIGRGWLDGFINRKDEYNITNTAEVAAMFARGTELVQPDLKRVCYPKSPDRPVWNECMAELERIRDEYLWGIISGQRPLEDFDVFVDLFNAQGGVDAVAETGMLMEKQAADYEDFKKNFVP